MADVTAKIQGGPMTPEEAALRLLQIIADVEGKVLTVQRDGQDREWVLSTYAECLAVVKGKHEPKVRVIP